MDFNHCRIVKRSLAGERAVDEQTFASVTILAERLERLRRRGENFGNVAFSPAVSTLRSTLRSTSEKLAKQKNAVVVG